MAVDMKSKGLPRHLRRWGLKVEEEPGWETRGRPYNFRPFGILVHHDASGERSGKFGALRVVRDGRPGLPGPLSQFVLGRDGTVKIVADGYSNHAGYGGPRAGIPRNMGNTYMVGIEAANNGIGERWSKEQLNAYYRLCAALMVWLGIKDVNKVFGHKEWTSRKIDPAGIDMRHFRRQVKKALRQGPSVKTIRLHKVSRLRQWNKDVKMVKNRLHKRGFMKKGRRGFNRRLNKKFLKAYADYQRSLGYRGKDADGYPGRTSLRKLGFRVVK